MSLTASPRMARSERVFFRFAILAIATLLAVSLVAAYPQVMELMRGRRSPGTEAGFGLRWLREIVWLATSLVLMAWLALGPERHALVSRATVILTTATLAYIGVLAARALLLGLPLEVVISGLRVFQYVTFSWLAYVVARRDPLRFFDGVGRVLRALLLIWTPLAVYQVMVAPPVHGRTMFRSRAFGTFNEANVFGVAVATCALWFVITHLLRDRPSRRDSAFLVGWLALCLTLAVLTGSRTALALTVVTFAVPAIWLLRRPIDRFVVAALAPVMLVVSLVIASTPAISGRQTDLLRDGRFVKWRDEIASGIDAPMDLLIGWGLGLGSNTVHTLFGYGRFKGQFVADSHYLYLLNGYGLIGVALFLVLLALVLMAPPRRPAIVFVVFVALFAVPFLPFELFPSNVLIMLAWGGLLGTGRRMRGSTLRVAGIGDGSHGRRR